MASETSQDLTAGLTTRAVTVVALTTDIAATLPITAPLPAVVVDIPPPPTEPPTVGTEITEFLRFQLTRPLTRRTIVLVVLLAAVAAGVVAWSTTDGGRATLPPAHVAVSSSTAGTVVTVTRGSANLSQLRDALSRSGHAGLISSVPGGAVEVNTDIVVGTRATLNIDGAALLLLSDAEKQVRLSVQGGVLNFDNDTISSWTAQGSVDWDPIGGRANLVATGRGTELNLTNCLVVGLGTAQDPGISWREGASGIVQDSRFSQDWRGAYAYKSGSLTILNSNFSNSRGGRSPLARSRQRVGHPEQHLRQQRAVRPGSRRHHPQSQSRW